jgi:hypothetical protein
MTNHHDHITPPLYRWSIDAARQWRRDHPHLWHACPALFRRLRVRVYEPHDMPRALVYVIGCAGAIAGFVACVIDMTR